MFSWLAVWVKLFGVESTGDGEAETSVTDVVELSLRSVVRLRFWAVVVDILMVMLL